jgi:hypothetical protein
MHPLRICDGRKTTTVLGEIIATSPVFGLRPIRPHFGRVENVPKEASLTISPLASALVISANTNSTSALASR